MREWRREVFGNEEAANAKGGLENGTVDEVVPEKKGKKRKRKSKGDTVKAGGD